VTNERGWRSARRFVYTRRGQFDASIGFVRKSSVPRYGTMLSHRLRFVRKKRKKKKTLKKPSRDLLYVMIVTEPRTNTYIVVYGIVNRAISNRTEIVAFFNLLAPRKHPGHTRGMLFVAIRRLFFDKYINRTDVFVYATVAERCRR